MNIEQRHARRTCRLFVLLVFGTVVIAFVLVVGLFHRTAAGGSRGFLPTAPTRK